VRPTTDHRTSGDAYKRAKTGGNCVEASEGRGD